MFALLLGKKVLSLQTILIKFIGASINVQIVLYFKGFSSFLIRSVVIKFLFIFAK